MWSVPDDALLEGMAAGDAQAAVAFVERYQRRVYGLAITITADAAIAEEVAQEALLRVWRHAAVFDARKGSVTTWVLAITRNLAIDAMRVRRPTSVEPEALVALVPPGGGLSPDDAAVLGDEVARLHAALAELPAEQRRAVVLSGIAGLSAREIAELDGIPLGTVKTRIRAALGRLRVLLAIPERAE